MEQFFELISTLTASPVMPVVVLAVTVIDGFFPPVPSETTVVIALAAVLAGASSPAWGIVIVAAAAVGAVVGDSVAFAVGRRVGLERFAWMRRPRVRRTTGWISGRVRNAPATIILVGRYIPVGRVAVNATAGASGLPYRRFLLLSAIAGTIWATTCLLVAWFSASVLADPLWAALLAIVLMTGLGLVIDHVSRRRSRSAA